MGVAGLGTVGAALVAQIGARARDAGRKVRPCDRHRRGLRALARLRTAASISENLNGLTIRSRSRVSPDIDVFVELMGGAGDPAKAAVEAALHSGKSVVTANKALLAKHGVQLAALAEKQRRRAQFRGRRRAAHSDREDPARRIAGNPVERIYGILNGTCNYILTRMEQEKMSFEECLKDAQRLGYAEADPSFDIEGHDTAQKLSILASLAFGTKVDESAIYVEGISSITPADLDRRRRTRLSHQAARRRREDGERDRAACPPDDAAQGFRQSRR